MISFNKYLLVAGLLLAGQTLHLQAMDTEKVTQEIARFKAGAANTAFDEFLALFNNHYPELNIQRKNILHVSYCGLTQENLSTILDELTDTQRQDIMVLLAEHNNFDAMPDLRHLKNLKVLWLGSNHLSEVSSDLLPEGLVWLSLYDNNLQSFSYNGKNLDCLNISHNSELQLELCSLLKMSPNLSCLDIERTPQDDYLATLPDLITQNNLTQQEQDKLTLHLDFLANFGVIETWPSTIGDYLHTNPKRRTIIVGRDDLTNALAGYKYRQPEIDEYKKNIERKEHQNAQLIQNSNLLKQLIEQQKQMINELLGVINEQGVQ